MMNGTLFTGVTQENFEERVNIFMDTAFPRPKSFETAAHEFVWRLDNKNLGLLAESSDSYEFDEMYLMAEIQSRTGAEWDSERYGEYYFDEQVYQAAIYGLIKGQYDETVDSEHIPF